MSAIEHKTVKLEMFPGRTLSLFLFEDVQNIAEIKNLLVNKQIRFGLINADYIAGDFQILVAATHALSAEKNKIMKTHDIHAELVYKLAGDKNIAASLRKFGLTSNTMKHLIVVVFDADDARVQEIRKLVRGTELSPALIGQHANMTAIRAHFKDISETELNTNSLLTALVSRIAVNDV
eukprot:TRINITY_DN13602_c0_g1_i3.p1 TRINITY_DN13602_c0_g1~~TRINITY_DN13602_c0_g1_i3.p1  ORF type:complete len:179 (+),score=41.85 TRINITY_DN13602_c0_g1_i3:340-876(+)